MKDYGATDWLLEGIVRVCVCCYPGETIYERFPHWRGLGLTISHGYCKVCFEKMRDDVRNEQVQKQLKEVYEDDL